MDWHPEVATDGQGSWLSIWHSRNPLGGTIGSDPDKRNYIVSNQRLREAGFEARRSLDTGIQEVLKGLRMLGREAFKNA